MPNVLGTPTVSRFEHPPDSHQIHMEFQVASGQTVHKGDQVILNTNGTVQAADAAAPSYTILGTSIHDGVAGGFVTIATRFQAVVNGEAAANTFNAGVTQLGAWNGTTGRREYAAAAGADDQAKDLVTIGFNIAPAVADGDAVQVGLLF